MKLSNLPQRAAIGAFVFHSGREKWRADEATAEGTHGLAVTAYPFLAKLPAPVFLRLLAAGEMAVGAALVVPVVPDRLAGAALTGFSGSLMGLYARAPGLRKPGSVWPTRQGIAVSKDVWMLGVGVGLLLDA